MATIFSLLYNIFVHCDAPKKTYERTPTHQAKASGVSSSEKELRDHKTPAASKKVHGGQPTLPATVC
jgi:hypothetical protein